MHGSHSRCGWAGSNSSSGHVVALDDQGRRRRGRQGTRWRRATPAGPGLVDRAAVAPAGGGGMAGAYGRHRRPDGRVPGVPPGLGGSDGRVAPLTGSGSGRSALALSTRPAGAQVVVVTDGDGRRRGGPDDDHASDVARSTAPSLRDSGDATSTGHGTSTVAGGRQTGDAVVGRPGAAYAHRACRRPRRWSCGDLLARGDGPYRRRGGAAQRAGRGRVVLGRTGAAGRAGCLTGATAGATPWRPVVTPGPPTAGSWCRPATDLELLPAWLGLEAAGDDTSPAGGGRVSSPVEVHAAGGRRRSWAWPSPGCPGAGHAVGRRAARPGASRGRRPASPDGALPTGLAPCRGPLAGAHGCWVG